MEETKILDSRKWKDLAGNLWTEVVSLDKEFILELQQTYKNRGAHTLTNEFEGKHTLAACEIA